MFFFFGVVYFCLKFVNMIDVNFSFYGLVLRNEDVSDFIIC